MTCSSGSSRSNAGSLFLFPPPSPPSPSDPEPELEDEEELGGIACAQTSKTFQVPSRALAVDRAVERLVTCDEGEEEEAFFEVEEEEAEELVVAVAPLPSASGASTAQAATSPSGRHCQASLVTRMRRGVMSSSSPSVFFFL